ncbi:hypothetical protein Srufu_018960 [Streptomyces libani subsp. rufus]|nr:hypothetical protein Srufu_018960 [Streptomyces libani subsp. rufus]
MVAGRELAHLGAYGVPHNRERWKAALDRLQREFGVRDSDVNELEAHLFRL